MKNVTASGCTTNFRFQQKPLEKLPYTGLHKSLEGYTFLKKTMETKALALQIFESHYSSWEANEKRLTNGYTYESTFVEMMRKVEEEVMQVSVGKVSQDKKKDPYQRRTYW